MPGAALFMMGDALVKAILWQDALGDLHGDNLWPISLRMGFVWPVGAFVVSVAMVVHKPDKPWTINKILLFLFALLAWAVGLSVYYHLGAPW